MGCIDLNGIWNCFEIWWFWICLEQRQTGLTIFGQFFAINSRAEIERLWAVQCWDNLALWVIRVCMRSNAMITWLPGCISYDHVSIVLKPLSRKMRSLCSRCIFHFDPKHRFNIPYLFEGIYSAWDVFCSSFNLVFLNVWALWLRVCVSAQRCPTAPLRWRVDGKRRSQKKDELRAKPI